MYALIARGDRVEEAVRGLDEDRLRSRHDNEFFFEHLRPLDVTLAFLKVSFFDDKKEFARTHLAPGMFIPLDEYAAPSSDILFYFHDLEPFLRFREPLPFDEAGFSNSGRSGHSTCSSRLGDDLPTLYSIDRGRLTDDIADRVKAHGGIEVFKEIKVPGDFLDLGRPKYQVSIRRSGGGFESWTPVHFDTLEEIRDHLAALGWKGLNMCQTSLSGGHEGVRDTQIRLDEMTIPYVMASEMIEKAIV